MVAILQHEVEINHKDEVSATPGVWVTKEKFFTSSPELQRLVVKTMQRYSDGDLTLISDVIRAFQERNTLEESHATVDLETVVIRDVMERRRMMPSRYSKEERELKVLENKDDGHSMCVAAAIADNPGVRPEFSFKEKIFREFATTQCIMRKDAFVPWGVLIKEFELFCDALGYKFFYPKVIVDGAFFAWYSLRKITCKRDCPPEYKYPCSEDFVIGITLKDLGAFLQPR